MAASMRQWMNIGKTTGWKSRRPGLERELTVTVAFFILLSVAHAVDIKMLVTNLCSHNATNGAVAGVGQTDEGSQEVSSLSEHGGNGNTCITAACNDTATMILNNMDHRVNPCENFYRYACGGYQSSAKISDDAGEINYFVSTADKLYEQLRAIIEAKIEPNEPKAYRLVKKYYKSCMNEPAIEARGVQPLRETLRRIGGWPIVEGSSWNESKFDLTEATWELRKAGDPFEGLIRFYVDINLLNSTEYAIFIRPSRWSIFDYAKSKDFYTKTLTSYFKCIVDIALILGAQNSTSTLQELAETLKFERQLRLIPIMNKTGNIADETPMTLAELKGKYPNIPWQEYIRKMLPSTVPVEKNQVVIVDNPVYFAQLDKLIFNTSKRVLANHIGWTTVFNSVRYLNKEIREKNQQFSAVLHGVTKAPPRWKLCVGSVSSLSFAIESMYARQYLSADTKRNAASMVNNIREAVRKMLETTNWLDQITKSRGLQKLDAMQSYIAYPDQPVDDKLDKIYENLEIGEDSYYENTKKVRLFNKEYSLGKLREPVDRSDMFGEMPAEVNAEYSLSKNIILLTAAMLQGVFFNKDRPQYMNYGAIGTIIGHEITHAFDGQGRQFNEKGERANWWQPSSEKAYLKRAQCIIDQYSNYTVQEVGLNVIGQLTRDENVADNGGIKGAYYAYTNRIVKNGEEPKLPGIQMTPNQLFWMSYANVWCSKYTPNELITRIIKDPHAPNEFRIVGSLSNFPEFAKDFSCPLGSKMYPTESCSVW